MPDRYGAAKPPPHNLPCELTGLVGRERELAEIERLLARTRLVTLTGSGGCGKARLAVAVVAVVVDGFVGRAWLVELASLSDPVLVTQTVASVLSVYEQPDQDLIETLSGYLRTRDILLVLDNCEHLIEACAALAATLLRSCSQLRVLATSRKALGIAGEVSWPVPALPFPDSRLVRTTESVARYDAVRLFAQRATAVAPTFELGTENMVAVAQVCERLDGNSAGHRARGRQDHGAGGATDR